MPFPAITGPALAHIPHPHVRRALAHPLVTEARRRHEAVLLLLAVLRECQVFVVLKDLYTSSKALASSPVLAFLSFSASSSDSFSASYSASFPASFSASFPASLLLG
jgi:hypothetical protein